jgi:membrane fusion protein, multidrug efflux system
MLKRIAIIVSILLVCGAIGWKLKANKAEMKASSELSSEKITEFPVETVLAASKSLSADFEALGSFEPSKEMNFLSEGQGKILAVNFKDGDRVSQGATAVRLDNEYQLSELDGAKLQLTKAQADVMKLDALAKAGGTTAQQVTDARFGIEIAQNKIASANILIRKSELKFPMTGIVLKRLAEVGGILGSGSPIAVLVDIDKLKFVANVDEAQVIALRNGQQVRVKPDVFSDRELVGTIKNIAVKANDAKKFGVEIELSNINGNAIRGGMSGKALFKRPNTRSILAVPRDAIAGSLQDAKVWVVDAQNIVRLKSITTGEILEDAVEVKAGLAAGERIVTSGQFNLQENAKVIVTK